MASGVFGSAAKSRSTAPSTRRPIAAYPSATSSADRGSKRRSVRMNSKKRPRLPSNDAFRMAAVIPERMRSTSARPMRCTSSALSVVVVCARIR
jgi:hypothetical protein